MSSGSYFPPPVKAVEIPKPHGGGVRVLGVPTVADRVAQTVVAMQLEERAEPRFHPDSYGYRPRKSALDAVGTCRQRCWRNDWVIDLDVQKFFDSVPWDLIVKAVEAVTDTAWVLLYVKRWLAAPLQLPEGTLAERDRGTPQGSAVSPILANLFMLRVRHVAGPEPSGGPVRTLRRRCCRALQEQAASRTSACRDRHADGRRGLAVAPGQDADRLLQGREAPGEAMSTPPSPSSVSRSGLANRETRTA
jgi:group II intron reverse transcriptase/maturase